MNRRGFLIGSILAPFMAMLSRFVPKSLPPIISPPVPVPCIDVMDMSQWRREVFIDSYDAEAIAKLNYLYGIVFWNRPDTARLTDISMPQGY